MKHWSTEAKEWLVRLAEEHPEEFFHALRDLIDERFPRGPGRRKGTGGVDDSARIDRVVELIRSGEETDIDEAIARAAHEDPRGPDKKAEKNTRRRLRRKRPDIEARLQDTREAEKAEILRRAFEEDFETWDL